MRDSQINIDEINTLVESFQDGGYAVHECHCGQKFFRNDDIGTDWDEGEFEKLQKGSATPLKNSVGIIKIGGKTFVTACDCWHKEGQKVINFLNGNRNEIRRFFLLRREKLRKELEQTPVIDED